MHIPNWLLKLLPMWEYICPKCRKEVKANSHQCPHCGEKYPAALRIPPAFLKDPKKLEAYVHQYIFPRVSKFERNYLTQFFTIFLSSGWENSGGTDVTDGGVWTGSYGNCSVVTSPAHSGKYALQMNAGTDQAYIYANIAAQPVLYTRVYVQTPAIAPYSDLIYFGGVMNCRLANFGDNSNDTVLQMQNITTGTWYTSASFNTTINTWYCIEASWQVGASTGFMQGWINGVQEINITGLNCGTANCSQVWIRAGGYGSYGAVKLLFDDVIISDSYNGPIASTITLNVQPQSVIGTNLALPFTPWYPGQANIGWGYGGTPSIYFSDSTVEHTQGSPSIRIEAHTTADINTWREMENFTNVPANFHYLLKAGDHLVLKVWVKCNPSTIGTPNGAIVPTNPTIYFDIADGATGGTFINSIFNAASFTKTNTIDAEALTHSFAPSGCDWTQIWVDVVIPATAMDQQGKIWNAPFWCTPEIHAGQPYGDFTGTNPSIDEQATAWFADPEVYINPTAAVPTNGTVTPNGKLTLIIGQSYQFAAVPAAGYQLDHWDLNGVNLGSANPFALTVTTAINGETLTAIFTIQPITLNVVAGANGSVSPAGTQTLTIGNAYTFTATPNSNYIFNYWSLAGVNIGTANPLSLTATTSMNGETLTAIFAVKTISLAVAAGPNGSVSPSGNQILTIGQSYPFIATPATEFAFNYWDLNGTNISSQASITLTASSTINGETLTAYFVQTQITLNVVAGANGSVSPAGTQTLTIGQSSTFAAIPASGYQLDHWDLNGVSQGSTNPLPLVPSLAMNAKTLTAIFTSIPPQQVTIDIETSGSGSVNLANGTHTFNVGSNVTFTAVAQSQYAFSKWTLGSATYTANPLTLPITGAMDGGTLTAIFIETSVTLNVTAGSNGSVMPSGPAQLNIGQSYLFSATPSQGYQLTSWMLNGISQGNNNPLTLVATAAMNGETLTAEFTVIPPQTVTLNVAAGANGSVSLSGPQTLTVGQSYQFTGTPNPGYKFDYWSLNGVNISIANPLNLIASSTINGETLVANFAPAQITLNIVAGPNGSVSPSGSDIIIIGQSYSVAAIAASGYQLDHWDLNGTNLGSTNPLPIVAALSMNNETLTALFTAIPIPQITINIATSGQGATNLLNGPHTFNIGDTITFSAIPSPEWAFVQWQLGSAIYTNNPLPLPITSAMNGQTLTAIFTQTTISLNIGTGVNGTTIPTGTVKLNIGQSYLFSEVPNPGYTFDHWDLSGANKGSSNPLTLVASAAMDAEVLTALFVETPPQTITLTLAASAGGSTDLADGPHTFNVGDTITINALPNTNAVFQNWTISGTIISTANPLLLHITADLNGETLIANFKGPTPGTVGLALLGTAGVITLAIALA